MGAAYIDSLDISNRALAFCGTAGEYKILSVDEDSRANDLCSFHYDKLRRAELMRNLWTFATRKVILRPLDTGVLLIDPAVWDETVTYKRGEVLQDVNGVVIMSNQDVNVGNDPNSTGAWEPYFGPRTVHPYDSTTTYYTGELVYKSGTLPGSFIVFMSLVMANDADPGVAEAYDAAATYYQGDRASYGGYNWTCLIPIVSGVTPAVAPADWSYLTTYSTSATVVASDGYIYTSTGNGNTNHDPVTDGGVHWTNSNTPAAWSRTPEPYTASNSWLPLYVGLQRPDIFYPINAGPASQVDTSNVYVLPAGFLKTAPLDPKAGSSSLLGAPTGLDYSDHLNENGLLTTKETGPILLRFVADVTDVTKFNDMFCEGLAARIAREICEPLTNSTGKLTNIGQAYQKFMSEARLVNAIEAGPTEPPEDDYITCRR